MLSYELGGFVILSADKREFPVLGYSDSGNFNLDSIPLGMAKWLDMSAIYMKHLRTSNAKQSIYAEYQWDNLSCELSLLKSAQLVECPPPTPPTSSETTITVGPLLNTTWDQGCSYNTYCPVLSGGPCGHAWSGCSTTAIAQIMYYWKYPTDYNWSAMSHTYGNDEVARLMGDIFPNAIDSYDTGASSCRNDYNIRHTFLNFGYQSASLAGYVNGVAENGGYNYQTVRSNLQNRQPVILGAYDDYISILGIQFPHGSGHIWVSDGYMQTTYFQNGVETSQYLFFHMNWGWNGNHDGWYAFNAWPYYPYFPDIIYNIHP